MKLPADAFIPPPPARTPILRRVKELEAINAELLAALEDAERRLRGAGMIGGLTNDPVVAAIAKTKGGGS